MSRRSTESVIAGLAAEARAVRPLAPPLARAARLLLLLGVVLAVPIVALGNGDGLATRYGGRDMVMIAETAAMLATAVLALCGAFALSIPGGSRMWLLAPLPSLLVWLGLAGAGCYEYMLRRGLGAWGGTEHTHCFTFLVVTSLATGVPVLWLLSRARPIDPLPVAALAGLGVAGLSAFVLQFFHPFAVTVVDLGFHILAVLLVVALAALLRRPTLAPA